MIKTTDYCFIFKAKPSSNKLLFFFVNQANKLKELIKIDANNLVISFKMVTSAIKSCE